MGRAPLTWRNVDAPNIGNASEILASAGRGWQEGFSNMAETLGGIQDRRNSAASNRGIEILARAGSEEEYQAALAELSSQVPHNQWDDNLRDYVREGRGETLTNDWRRAQTRSVIGGENRDQETHNRGIQRENDAAMFGRAVASNHPVAMGGGGGGQGRASVAFPEGMDEREVVARTIQAEAGGEGFDGMRAVGHVMANRARTGRWGPTLGDVALADGQFSAWNGYTGYAGGSGGLDMANIRPSQEAYAAADEALSGNYEDMTGGATHYYNDQAANPNWGAGAGGSWTRHGNHLFGVPAGEQGMRGVPNIGEAIQGTQLLSANDLLPHLDTLGNAEDTAYTRNRTRRGLAEEDRLEALNQEARGIVQSSFMDILDNPSGWMANQLRSGADPDLVSAVLRHAEQMQESMPGVFNIDPSTGSVPERARRAFGDVTSSSAYREMTNEERRVYENSAQDANRSAGDVFAEHQSVLNDAELEGLNQTVFLRAVASIAGEYGLSQGSVARLALQHLESKRYPLQENTRTDEDKVRALVESVWGDFQSASDNFEQGLNDQLMADEANELEQQYFTLTARRSHFLNIGEPEDSERIQRIDQQLDQLNQRTDSLSSRAREQARSYDQARGRGSAGSDTEDARATVNFGRDGRIDQGDSVLSRYIEDLAEFPVPERPTPSTEHMPIEHQVHLAVTELASDDRLPREARRWFNSLGARRFFEDRPDAMEEALRDPVRFWERMMEITAKP